MAAVLRQYRKLLEVMGEDADVGQLLDPCSWPSQWSPVLGSGGGTAWGVHWHSLGSQDLLRAQVVE